MKHRPEGPQRHALLPSAGLNYRLSTPHEFVRFEEVPAEQLRGHRPGALGQRPGQALIYRCEKTGAERRWGIW